MSLQANAAAFYVAINRSFDCIESDANDESGDDSMSLECLQWIQRALCAWDSLASDDTESVFVNSTLKASMAVVSKSMAAILESSEFELTPLIVSELMISRDQSLLWPNSHTVYREETIRSMHADGVPPVAIARKLGWKSGEFGWDADKVTKRIESGKGLDEESVGIKAAKARRAKVERLVELMADGKWMAQIEESLMEIPVNGFPGSHIEATPNVYECVESGMDVHRAAKIIGVPADVIELCYSGIAQTGLATTELTTNVDLDHLTAIARGLGIVVRSANAETVLDLIRKWEMEHTTDEQEQNLS